jgi:hypothetical protein
MKQEAGCRPSKHTRSKLDAAWLNILPRHLRTGMPYKLTGDPSGVSPPLEHITRFSRRLSIAVLKRNNPKRNSWHRTITTGCTPNTRGSLQSTARQSWLPELHIPCVHRWVFQALTSDIVSLLQVPPLSDKEPTRTTARSGKVPSFDEMQRDHADKCILRAKKGGIKS